MSDPKHRQENEHVSADILPLMLQNINSSVSNVADKLGHLDEKLSKHIVDETNELANEIVRVMLKAFPRGDPDAHRLHHELAIRKAEASASFWQTLATELAKYGLIGFIGWAGYALWKAFLAGPR